MSVQLYVYNMYVCHMYVYTQEEAEVPKPSRVQMGHVRPKINDVAVVYWQLNVKHQLISMTRLVNSEFEWKEKVTTVYTHVYRPNPSFYWTIKIEKCTREKNSSSVLAL